MIFLRPSIYLPIRGYERNAVLDLTTTSKPFLLLLIENKVAVFRLTNCKMKNVVTTTQTF